MRNGFGTLLRGSRLLRAALALVVLLFTSLQPAVATQANPGTPSIGTEIGEGGLLPSLTEEHHHSVGDAQDRHHDGAASHHGEDMRGDVCEVHCSPVTAILVECVSLRGPANPCFEQQDPAMLVDSDRAGFIRPPRS